MAVSSGGGNNGSSNNNVAAFDGSGGALLNQGKGMLAKAQRMPAGPARNAAYKEAAAVFSRAQQKLTAAGQDSLAVEANKNRYACMKMITE